MILIRFTGQFDFEYDIQGIIRSFYPEEQLKSIKELGCDSKKYADKLCGGDVAFDEQNMLVVECGFDDRKMRLELKKESAVLGCAEFERVYDGNEYNCDECSRNEYNRRETKNRLKRALYDLFHAYTGRELAWGTLSGIRPTKITSALLEQGMSEEQTCDYMKREYYLSDLKARESIEISGRELDILAGIDYKNGYSLYIGIPFCPSTCLYCSFTSNPIGIFKDKVDAYLEALFLELDFCAKQFKSKNLCTIYIGGGTPTSLTAAQLDRLLMKISRTFDTKRLHEFTIEAGRPDSITEEKLKVIRNYDITRISVNPQTMKEETLRIIGRHHTVEQFLKAYDMARSEGFDNINMDFILGLPGENIDDVRNSMREVERLKPDSLTIHSLAVKRAARLNMEQRAGKSFDINNSEEMMQVTADTAERLGLKPYYLYRQKNMAGNLENIGYASERKEGIYNIMIMEEKQTILATGAGSSSKMVDCSLDRIERIENVKDVDLYIQKIDEMIDRKRRYIDENEI